MVIRQGDVFWVELGVPRGSEPAYRHPYVVIQNDVFNTSRIGTTIAVALTSNLSRANIPGNVQLRKGEANLPKASVVKTLQAFRGLLQAFSKRCRRFAVYCRRFRNAAGVSPPGTSGALSPPPPGRR